jgi:1-acyl-sn-glycerol-3-phosphate acyltransferase
MRRFGKPHTIEFNEKTFRASAGGAAVTNPSRKRRQRRRMSYLRALAFMLAMAFFVLLVAPVQAVARRFDWPLQHRIQRFFCRTMCGVIGIEVAGEGAPGTPAGRLIVANHVSWTDILAIASLHPCLFLAKAEVAAWPVLGFLAKIQGTIFVDRGKRSAIPAVNAALAEQLRAGRDVVVFAEGTSTDGGKVLKFNASHFAMLHDLAQDAAARDVLASPVAFAYAPRGRRAGPFDAGWYGDMSFLPHLWSLMRKGGARCEVLFGQSLVPAAFPDRKALAQAAQQSVEGLLERASARRAGGL